jgi:predicted nucleotide-binding protein
MVKRVKIIPPPPIPRKPPPEKPIDLLKKQKTRGEEPPKKDFLPLEIQRPTPPAPPEEPIELLKRKKTDGEELLKKDFLSVGEVQQWNALTKDILTKFFAPDSHLIGSVLYAGEQQVYSLYEPESLLEKQRRKNFQASLRMMEICIEEFELNKDSSKPDIIRKIESRVVSERQAFMAQSQEEGKKELELSKEPFKPDIIQRIENRMASEGRKAFIVRRPDEAKKEPEVSKEPPKPGITEEIENTEASNTGKVSIDLGKEIELIAEPSKPDMNKRMESMETSESRKVFIVHGNDEEKKEAVAKFLTKMELEPVILHEQPGYALTLIDKFEHYADVVFAIIILTGDDYGYARGKPEESMPRPSQNVVFELGFLIGRLPEQCVCTLYEEGLEMPFDYKGAVFIPHDAGGIWKLLIARAMKTANLDLDLNRVV